MVGGMAEGFLVEGYIQFRNNIKAILDIIESHHNNRILIQ